ncbi:MAG: NAD(P)-binding domain-containing protein [Ancrocorticia sp.]
MGLQLARNLAHKGYKVAIHNRSVSKTEKVWLIMEEGEHPLRSPWRISWVPYPPPA